jgi:hypothetical protein
MKFSMIPETQLGSSFANDSTRSFNYGLLELLHDAASNAARSADVIKSPVNDFRNLGFSTCSCARSLR